MVVLAGIERPAHTPHAIVSDVHLGDGDGLSFYLAASLAFPTSAGSSRLRRGFCRLSHRELSFVSR